MIHCEATLSVEIPGIMAAVKLQEGAIRISAGGRHHDYIQSGGEDS